MIARAVGFALGLCAVLGVACSKNPAVSVGHVPSGWSVKVVAVERLDSISFRVDRPFQPLDESLPAPGWTWLQVYLDFQSNQPERAISLLWLKARPIDSCPFPGEKEYYLGIGSGRWGERPTLYPVSANEHGETVFLPLAIEGTHPDADPRPFIHLLHYRGQLSVEGWEIGPSPGATRLALHVLPEGVKAGVVLMYGVPSDCDAFEIAELPTPPADN